jgi:transcriptional regulator GlxA family with amidase domain
VIEMRIAALHYERMTALDLVGPCEILAGLPGAELISVAAEPGPKRCDQGLVLVAEHALADVPRPDVVLVPGSSDPSDPIGDERVRAWLRAASAHARMTASVCTGSLVLGAAGLLQGRRATSHWAALELLRGFGAEPVAERVVFDDPIVTAAGVASGIDMALHLAARLAGDHAAQVAQLIAEYDPAPPFDCGSPGKASPEVLSAARELLGVPSPAAHTP